MEYAGAVSNADQPCSVLVVGDNVAQIQLTAIVGPDLMFGAWHTKLCARQQWINADARAQARLFLEWGTPWRWILCLGRTTREAFSDAAGRAWHLHEFQVRVVRQPDRPRLRLLGLPGLRDVDDRVRERVRVLTASAPWSVPARAPVVDLVGLTRASDRA